MTAKATLRYARVPARKARYVVDLIRGKDVEDAIQTLTFSRRRAARAVLKLLNSAVANAEQRGDLDLDLLYVQRATVDVGPTMKRIRPRAQGRAYLIRRRTCHITLELAERIG
ncbi:MAG: 50S ribosomal protein L22 [Candidatus Dadabacteria bacterium]|nr:MAG: 50S ribosomal protein L22 [Candidatus Dadabacteria bacterium]